MLGAAGDATSQCDRFAHAAGLSPPPIIAPALLHAIQFALNTPRYIAPN
jgi:hypothetical protein